ncbi:hypothetical protein D3C78_1006520 [compost metagenome]
MGDGGIAEQALDVVLHQGQQVAEQDRGDGDHGQQVVQPAAGGGRGHLVQAQQHGEHGHLAGGGQEGRHRRRGAFVHVRGPEVEGDQGELEGQADEHHADTDLRQQGVTGRGQLAEAQAAGFGVEQGHAEQQEGGTGGRQHHVLDAGFQGTLVEEGVRHQAVDRYREQFQADEQAGQVLRGDQHQAAGGGQEDQQVHLLAVARVALAGFTAQVGVDQGDAGEGAGQDQGHVIGAEVVHHHQRGHLQRGDLEGWEDGNQGQVQTDDREAEGPGVVPLPGDGQHDHDNGGAGDQQRQEGDQVLSREFHELLTGLRVG